MKVKIILGLLTLVMMFGVVSNADATYCIKNGQAQFFLPSFEPCANYWDRIVNDNGSNYVQPLFNCGIAAVKTKVPTKVLPAMTGAEVAKMKASMNNMILKNCTLAPIPGKPTEFWVRYQNNTIGHIRDKAEFLNFQGAVKK